MSIPDETKLQEAWAIFDKAADLEARVCADPAKSDNAKNMARKNADKKLAEAAKLEEEAFAA